MFKKVEIWILYLVILMSFPIAIAFGILVRQELVGINKFGKLSEGALFLTEIPKTLKDIFLYMEPKEDYSLSNKLFDRFPNLNGFNGNPNSQESYLLLSKYDGDLQEGIVELVDLTNFEVLHTWNPDIDQFNKPL